jgi:hypothetical protein
MKRIILSCIAMLLGAVAGCGAEDKCAKVTCAAGEMCDATSGACLNPCGTLVCTNGQTCDPSVGMCANPMAPTPGMLIDRMGRPGVNTALTNPFDLYKQAGQTTAEVSDVTKDRYNLDAGEMMWAVTWSPAVRLHLGIFDALDDMCGNQAGYGALSMPNYTLLAAVLAGDALQIDASKFTCNQYLGAELAALGAPVMDCGGRKLNYDVIDVTYSALAAGVTAGVTDGPIGENTPAGTTFPYMTAPQ